MYMKICNQKTSLQAELKNLFLGFSLVESKNTFF